MQLKSALFIDLGPIGVACVLIEVLIILVMLVAKPWMRYKYLHNKGIAFLLAYGMLLALGDLEVPALSFLAPLYVLIGFCSTFLLLPLWIAGIATVLAFFCFSFLVKEELRTANRQGRRAT